MSAIYIEKETQTQIDESGNEYVSVKETTKHIERLAEPDYIKLYTKMWCEFNSIPNAYRELFLQLAMRMSYCQHTADGIGGQIVNTGGIWKRDIMSALGWTSNSMYQRGLQALCNCGAIRKIGRAEYQINPQYAGRGEWKYNPRLNRGGVEDLVATFSFRNRKSDVKIVWADDGSNTELNVAYREGLGVTPQDNATLKTINTINS